MANTSSPYSKFGNPIGASQTFQQYLDAITIAADNGIASCAASVVAADAHAAAALAAKDGVVASIAAAANSASQAATSASSASSSATAAANSATSASTSASSVSSNATAAATSATTAQTHRDAAASSATAASTSATNAAGSATSASNAANAASGYADLAGTAANSANGYVAQAAASAASSSQKNRIHNPCFAINQHQSGSYTPATEGFVADRWQLYGQGKLTAVTMATDFPTIKFPSMLKVTNAATGTTATSTQIFGLLQRIEGHDIADWGFGTSAASPIGVTATIRTSVTGSYSIMVRNGLATRCYVRVVALTANTDTTVQFVIPGDTGGGTSWASDASAGCDLWFDLGSGSSFLSATPNAWGSTNYLRASSNGWLAAANASFKVSGVQIERLPVGATTCTPLSIRDTASELAVCQRYYETGTSYLVGYSAAGSNAVSSTVQFKSTKRSTPAITTNLFSAANCTAAQATNISGNEFEIARTITSLGQFTGHVVWTASSPP